MRETPPRRQNDRSNPAHNCIRVSILISPERQSDGGYIFGLGQTTYLMFKVQTRDFKWVVHRRYSDFIWLRNNLARLYPHYLIPPIPKKNKHKKNMTDLNRRMQIL
jgi:hypothetical protein